MAKGNWLLAVMVLTLTGVIVYNKVWRKPATDSPMQQNIRPKEIPVTGYVVKASSLNHSITAAGTLLPRERTELRPEVSGKIVYLHLPEAKQVAAGTLLVKLDDREQQAQLKKLRLLTETAEKTEQRLRQLTDAGGAGKQEYEQALTNLQTLRAEMELVQAAIAKTEIRAPFTGILGLRQVSIGAYVTPATVISTLQQIHPMILEFSIPERYAGWVRPGHKVNFKADGDEGEREAVVYAAEPVIDDAARSVRIRANVSGTPAGLAPGTFASVKIPLQSGKVSLVVPVNCILPDARDKKVIVIRGGKAEFRTVSTGLRSEAYTEITDGLAAGDTIAAGALMSLRPGAEVRVVKWID
ncbi:MAG: efflux RND transporter periplasmic adaptor subunit [Chitinophagales bacterium]|nr:efflux RND transporter periplasmic adaptor subunit [Chitinophagales bacterium]MDW8419574.1 efflux RND transporter periplasmic adaptor subunit [Chitinophagales bacterium]